MSIALLLMLEVYSSEGFSAGKINNIIVERNGSWNMYNSTLPYCTCDPALVFKSIHPTVLYINTGD